MICDKLKNSSKNERRVGRPALLFMFGVKMMAKKKQGGNTVEAVRNIAVPIAGSLGLEIWDIRFLKEGSQWYLRIFIDKQEGITIEDCEAMSRAIDKPLDELDPISQSYCLEVCSPGIERELVRNEHFERFIGDNIKVRLIRENTQGQKEIFGKLLGLEGNSVKVDDGDKVIYVDRKDTVSIRLDDFDN